jgi:RNA-binding protein
MLTPKNKALLKKLANHLEPSVNVGKGEIDDSLIETTSNALKAHELIKVRVLNNSSSGKEEVAAALAKATKSDVVATIGSIIVLYKAREDHPSIILS